MAQNEVRLSDSGHVVIPLGTEPPVEPEPTVTRPTRMHGLSIAGMALAALVGSAALFLLVSVGLTDATKSVVIAVTVISVILFLTSASIAMLTAARDTFATGSRDSDATPRG